MIDLTGDPIRFLLVSKKYKIEKHGVFSVAISMLFSGVEKHLSEGRVLDSINSIFKKSKVLDGSEPSGYELGCWAGRFMCEYEFSYSVESNIFFAWVNSDFWDYTPACVLYSREEFSEIFEDCCRNYLAINSDRRDEFSVALIQNGMSI